jgi:hypothetical protein
MRIADGAAETHETPLKLDASATPGVQRPTAIQPGQLSGPTQAALDTTAMNAEQQRQGEADCAAAMSTGMTADLARRQHYESAMMPIGAGPTDEMALPVVPANAVPPAMSNLYPYAGMEPTPAAAGFDDPAYGT